MKEWNQDAVKVVIEQIQNEIVSDLRDFEETIRSKQQTGASSIDAALAEFNSWKQQIRTQFDESVTLYSEELSKKLVHEN